MILSKIDASRYGNGGYFFVYQYYGVKLVATENKAMVGKNLWDLKDAKGFLAVQEFFKVSNDGGGFINYTWLNPTTKKNEAKVSMCLT